MSAAERPSAERPRPTGPSGAAEIEAQAGDVRVVRQADWLARFPWLVQGVTSRELDFASRTERSARGRTDPWESLLRGTRMRAVARVRQVHGARVITVERDPDGSRPEADALATDRPGVLLAISVADCVPVFLIDPESRAIGLAHAGWRGVAAGVVEAVLERMERVMGSEPRALHAHLGPAICGVCYEVGPEVPAALGLESSARFVDLRDRIHERLVSAGLDPARISRSGLCTRCDRDLLLSFRGGDRTARMCAYLGALGGC